jgi:hypothetical protein
MTLQQQSSIANQLLEQTRNPLVIEIISPLTNSTFPIGSNNNLTVIGTSSDNSTRNCRVEYIVNNITNTNSYRNVTAAGPGGTGDFSQWNVTLTPVYYRNLLIEGPNKITARLFCPVLPSDAQGPVKHFSIQLVGIRTTESIVNNTAPIPNMTGNSLSISVSKDPIALGDDQNIEVRLYDPAVPGRQVIPALARFTLLGSLGEPIDGGGFWGPNLANSTSINYDFEIDADVEPGNFTAIVEAWTYTSGLQPSSKAITFEVVEELDE